MLFFVLNYRGDLSLFDISREILGKKVGNVCNFVLCLIGVVIATTSLFSISNFVSSQYLIRTPLFLVSVLLIIVVIFNVSKGFQVISRIICSVNDEKVKLHLLDVMPLDNYYKTDILTTISDTTKASIILNNTYNLKPHEASQVLGSMDTDFFIDYVNEHTDFFSKNGISIQSVVRYFPMKEQISFANKIYNINISVR
mgnify:CR=1 FL=1